MTVSNGGVAVRPNDKPSPTPVNRLLKGFGASALYPVVTAIVQLLTVPIFLRVWGPTLYGEWLVLTTVPQYMALSDMGFGSVAGNDMTMRIAAHDREGALCTFQSAWIMICALSAVIGIAAVFVLGWLPIERWLHLAIMQPSEVHTVLLLLIIYSLGTLQTNLASAGFRCDGHYALGTVLLNLIRLVEALGAALCVVLGAAPPYVAGFLVAARLLGHLAMCSVLRRRSPWIRWGVTHAHKSAIYAMLRPAMAFMAFPLSNAMSIQGMLIVIGLARGPNSVTIFSTLRTLARVGLMIVETVRQSIWPELSTAFGANDLLYARRLHTKGCQASIILCGSAMLFLSILGRPIYRYWTHGLLPFEVSIFYVLILVMVANSLWYASSSVSLACNSHQTIAGVLLSVTVASLPLAYFLTLRVGLLGPAIMLVAVDVIMVPYVLINSLSLLGQSFSEFSRGLLAPPNFQHLVGNLTKARS